MNRIEATAGINFKAIVAFANSVLRYAHRPPRLFMTS